MVNPTLEGFVVYENLVSRITLESSELPEIKSLFLELWQSAADPRTLKITSKSHNAKLRDRRAQAREPTAQQLAVPLKRLVV